MSDERSMNGVIYHGEREFKKKEATKTKIKSIYFIIKAQIAKRVQK